MNAGTRPELIIFDCDGVLVDSERLTIEVEARVLTEMGWPISTAEVVERFMGRSDGYMLNEIAARIGTEQAAEFDRVTTEEIVEAFKSRLQPIEGVADLVQAATAAGIASCVASSGSYRKMDLTLSVTNLAHFFEGRIYSASEVDNGKPAPDLFLYAAKTMGFAPQSCVVIEDSIHGVAAAVAAGMTCYGFAGGLTETEALQQAGATTFDTMNELSGRLLT